VERPVGHVIRSGRTAQEPDDLRRDFLAYIAHELKTPAGALALLAETMASEDDPEISRRLADRMLNEAHRIGRMIQELLEHCRADPLRDSGNETVPVAAVVAEALDHVRPAAHAKDIRLEFVDDAPNTLVDGSRVQLVAAVRNLIENAVKYSPEHATVAVATTEAAGAVSIGVRDAGIGIDAGHLSKIFERYYRTDAARSRDPQGNGLGLAIVRLIVERHGGDVDVRSQPGRGSTFVVRLPVATSVRI
jgi:two-component system, OmpR family, sensor histidine kinase SenX3